MVMLYDPSRQTDFGRTLAPKPTTSTLRPPVGGGMALPPFLENRPAPNFRPAITPRPQIDGDRIAPQGPNIAPISFPESRNPLVKDNLMYPGGTPGFYNNGGAGRPPNVAPTVPQPKPIAGVPTLGTNAPAAQQIFEFLKSDLMRNSARAKDKAIADAAERGVYYGSPLTTSMGDIETEFQRGLGQLAAQTLQNEQGNELERLRLATGLIPQASEPDVGGVAPEFFGEMGKAFAPRPTSTTAPAAGAPTIPGLSPEDLAKLREQLFGNVQLRGVSPPSPVLR